MIEAVRSFYQMDPLVAWIITVCAAVTVAAGVYLLATSLARFPR